MLIGTQSLDMDRIHHVAGSNGGPGRTVNESVRFLRLILSLFPPHLRRLTILSTLLDFLPLHLCIATVLWDAIDVAAPRLDLFLSLRFSAIRALEPLQFLVLLGY